MSCFVKIISSLRGYDIPKVAVGVIVSYFLLTNLKSKFCVIYVPIISKADSAKVFPKQILFPPAKGDQDAGFRFPPLGVRLIGLELSNLSGINS